MAGRGARATLAVLAKIYPMKTSKKILISVAGILIALVVVGLLMLRNDLLRLLSQEALENNYQEVPVDPFEALDFSARWTVRIKQGREHKVEVAVAEGGGLKPNLENVDGRLYFHAERADQPETTERLRARVTLPSLREIKAAHDTEIRLENFKADSLRIILEDGGLFTGVENEIEHVSFQTSGEARIQWTDDPWK